MFASVIVLCSLPALGAPGGMAESQGGARYVAATRTQAKRTVPSPTLEIKRSTEALRKTLSRRHPEWSPEAEVQAASVQNVIDGMLDFEEIARRTLADQWETLTPDQRREFVAALQKIIERKPLDRGLRIDVESTVDYKGESIVKDEATVSSLVTSYNTGRPNRRAVEYKLCFRQGRWRVYDLVVEGVSLVDDYRDQFSRIIAQESFDGLMKRLRKKVGGAE